MKRKHISSGSEFEEKIGYSRAVVDGDYVFVSGTTGYDYDTMTISADPVEQAEQCFRNIEKALIQAGSSVDNIVRVHYIFRRSRTSSHAGRYSGSTWIKPDLPLPCLWQVCWMRQ